MLESKESKAAAVAAGEVVDAGGGEDEPCTGGDSDEREKKLTELTSEFNDATSLNGLLQSQVTALEEDMRHLAAALQNDGERLAKLVYKKREQALLKEGGEKQVEAKRDANARLQVEQNVLRLRCGQMFSSLDKEGGLIYGLQRRQLDLETAMRERQAEVALGKELLMAKKRTLDEENGKLRIEYQRNRAKLRRLRKNHDSKLSM